MSALPIGLKLPKDQLAATRLTTAQLGSLVNTLLALVFSPSGRCDDLLQAAVAGVVCITAVDKEKQKITLLSPSPLPLPSSTLLSGTLRWSG